MSFPMYVKYQAIVLIEKPRGSKKFACDMFIFRNKFEFMFSDKKPKMLNAELEKCRLAIKCLDISLVKFEI